MYAALNEEEKLVNAIECDRQGKYKCPKCFKPVKLIFKKDTTYFRHENCRNNQTNERPTHKLGKALLIESFQKNSRVKVRAEVYLAEIDQRPDIMIGDKLAVEYQCAKIDVRTLSDRVNKYLQAGIKNLWILGEDYLESRPTRQHLKFIAYNPNWGFYLLMLDTKTKKLTLFYEIRFVGPFNKMCYRKKSFKVKNFRHLLLFKPKMNQLKKTTITSHQIGRIRTLKDPKINNFKVHFFQRKHQRVEDFLTGTKFEMLKPIYQTYHWMIKCGSPARRIRQPLLNKKRR